MDTENSSSEEAPVQTDDVKEETSQEVSDAAKEEKPADQTDNKTEDSSKPADKDKPKKPKNKKLIVAVIVLVLLLLAAGAYFFFIKKSPKKSITTNTATTTKPAENSTQVKPTDNLIINGNTYFATPVKLDDLHFYANPESYFGQSCDTANNCTTPLVKSSDILYYQIGTTKDGQKIIEYVVPGIMDATQSLALTAAGGKYSILAQMSPTFSYMITNNPTNLEDYRKALSSNVSLDTTTKLSELIFPKDVTINNQKLTGGGVGSFLKQGLKSINAASLGTNIVDESALTKVGESGNFKFYKVNTKTGNSSNFTVYTVRAVFGNLFSAQYNLSGELTSSKDALKINWSNGESNSSKYFTGGPGCGWSSTYVVADNINKSQLTQVGSSQAKQPLYQLPTSNALVSELYTKDYSQGQAFDDASLKNLTIQQFSDKHAYFLVQNGWDEYVIMQRDDMFMRGGCAKPVVYLYPNQPTNVSVSVDADVTKSDPLYPANGWQNVLAKPDGSLTYKGQQYSSLFWEGFGHGEYPLITSGTVAPSNQATTTIRSQLYAQGLNKKEADDFLAFWAPKLPKTPYVRLTWFGTSQLQKLAYLNVAPRPQTLIRVFLDFEGLNKPINLPSQHFVTPARQGFTVVEWGGLARDGSVPLN